MKFKYISISEPDFGRGMTRVNEMASEGWRLISSVTRGRAFHFIMEKESSQ